MSGLTPFSALFSALIWREKNLYFSKQGRGPKEGAKNIRLCNCVEDEVEIRRAPWRCCTSSLCQDRKLPSCGCTGRQWLSHVPLETPLSRCPSPCRQPITLLAAGESLPRCFCCLLRCCSLAAREWALKRNKVSSMKPNYYLAFVFRLKKSIWVKLRGLKFQVCPMYDLRGISLYSAEICNISLNDK